MHVGPVMPARPHGGDAPPLLYRNGRAISVQPHPEFADDYAIALAELRRGKTPEENIQRAIASVSRPSDSDELAGYLGAFIRGI